MAQGVVLCQSTALAAGTFVGSSRVWVGGRTALQINAAAYGATVQLQCQSVANSSVWIPMNSTTISADSVVGYDAPAGTYRMSLSGSSAGVNAALIEIPYK